MRIAALILALSGSLCAQVQVGMSPLAYVLDESSHALRPLIGTPGSAYLGRAVAMPFGIRRAELRGANGALVNEAGVAFRVSNLELTEIGPASQVWVDDGGALVLLAESAKEVRLAGGPLFTLPGAVTAVAFVSRCAVLAVAGEEGSTLYRLCADKPGELQMLRALPGVNASALAAAGGSLFVGAKAQRRVLLLREQAEPVVFETEALLLALAAVSANEVLAAVENESRLLALPSGEWMELGARADRLQWLMAGRLLACTPVSAEEPLLVLDLAQDRGSFFVPITRSEE